MRQIESLWWSWNLLALLAEQIGPINPSTADVAYIRVLILYNHIKSLKFIIINNFHSLEVVDRVSETQLQVGENSDRIIWRLKG